MRGWKLGLREWLRRRPQGRLEPRIEFLGEQDGAIERQLKDAFLPLLQASLVQRAYLVRVGFQPPEAGTVALALIPKGAEDIALVKRVGDRFRTLAPADVFLDILFLSDVQEEDVARVCLQFYSRAS